MVPNINIQQSIQPIKQSQQLAIFYNHLFLIKLYPKQIFWPRKQAKILRTINDEMCIAIKSWNNILFRELFYGSKSSDI